MVRPWVQSILLVLAIGWTITFVCFLFGVIVMLFAVVFHVEMGSLTAQMQQCNVSQFNESFVIFEGNLDYAPRVEPDGLPLGAHCYNYGGKECYVAEYCTRAQKLINYCFKCASPIRLRRSTPSPSSSLVVHQLTELISTLLRYIPLPYDDRCHSHAGSSASGAPTSTSCRFRGRSRSL